MHEVASRGSRDGQRREWYDNDTAILQHCIVNLLTDGPDYVVFASSWWTSRPSNHNLKGETRPVDVTSCTSHLQSQHGSDVPLFRSRVYNINDLPFKSPMIYRQAPQQQLSNIPLQILQPFQLANRPTWSKHSPTGWILPPIWLRKWWSTLRSFPMPIWTSMSERAPLMKSWWR